MKDAKIFSACAGNEFGLMNLILESEELLPYPLKTVCTNDGLEYSCYEIPMEDKGKVLEELYPFEGVPSLDAVLYDIHQEEFFTVRDYLVVRQDGRNYLVSPYYPFSGGTVIDWVEMGKSSVKGVKK